MARKTTLETIASMLTKQSKETHDLTETVGVVVKHTATNRDIGEVKQQVVALQTLGNSIERELREARTGIRFGNLETEGLRQSPLLD